MANLQQLGPTTQPEEQLDPPVEEIRKLFLAEGANEISQPLALGLSKPVYQIDVARFNDFATKIAEQSGGEMAEEPLVYALLGTHGKYESNQDRAQTIIKRLRAKK